MLNSLSKLYLWVSDETICETRNLLLSNHTVTFIQKVIKLSGYLTVYLYDIMMTLLHFLEHL